MPGACSDIITETIYKGFKLVIQSRGICIDLLELFKLIGTLPTRDIQT